MHVTHGSTLSFEEYGTLFTRIESILNSRPLCYKELPAQVSEVITPAHFLIGDSLMEVPKIDTEDVPLSNRLQLIRNLTRGFWRIWSKDYINQIQKRDKWKTAMSNISVGQVVLIKMENVKPCDWPLGIVVEVYPAKDNLVRTVDVKFQGSVKKRVVLSLVPLPVDPEPKGSAGEIC